MKLGKQVNWNDIKVGEVFAVDGCCFIFEKYSENRARHLAEDYSDDFDGMGDLSDLIFIKAVNIHKLYLSVQRLWRCDYE